jgi:hypothetical protein
MDFRNATFMFHIDDNEAICEYPISIGHLLKGKNAGIIVDNPESTVMACILEFEAMKIGFSIKFFILKKWLGVG